MMRALLLAVVFLVAGARADLAQPLPVPDLAPGAPASRPEPGTLAAEIERSPTCQHLSNGCEICKADEPGKLSCSTPGIACQPRAWQCDGIMVPREMEPGR
ncbi:MAG: hypothetical protein JSS20_12900 [Proteobacteria bacterium]|nr:hypothetical protein [Pseudomonadota bacterium]